jgi:hypothetical protein
MPKNFTKKKNSSCNSSKDVVNSFLDRGKRL